MLFYPDGMFLLDDRMGQNASDYGQHMVMYIVFYPSAILLNILLVVVILTKKELRESKYCWTLVHTSLTAVAFVLNAYVYSIMDFRHDTKWLSSTSCHVTSYIDGVVGHVLKFSVMLVSVDRVWAVWRPENFPQGLNRTAIVASILLMWAAILLIFSPVYFKAFVKTTGHYTLICDAQVSLKAVSVYHLWPYLPIFIILLSDVIAFIYFMCSRHDYIDSDSIQRIGFPTVIMDLLFVGLYFPYMVKLFCYATGNLTIHMPSSLFFNLIIIYWSIFPLIWLLSRGISREVGTCAACDCCERRQKKGEAARLISIENVQEFQYVDRPAQITIKLPSTAIND